MSELEAEGSNDRHRTHTCINWSLVQCPVSRVQFVCDDKRRTVRLPYFPLLNTFHISISPASHLSHCDILRPPISQIGFTLHTAHYTLGVLSAFIWGEEFPALIKCSKNQQYCSIYRQTRRRPAVEFKYPGITVPSATLSD